MLTFPNLASDAFLRPHTFVSYSTDMERLPKVGEVPLAVLVPRAYTTSRALLNSLKVPGIIIRSRTYVDFGR